MKTGSRLPAMRGPAGRYFGRFPPELSEIRRKNGVFAPRALIDLYHPRQYYNDFPGFNKWVFEKKTIFAKFS